MAAKAIHSIAKPFDSASLIVTVPIPKNELKAHFPYNYKILMAKRVENGSFSNAHVFPGGKLDSSDSLLRWAACTNANTASSNDNLDKFKICAIREAFEETGLLAADKLLSRSELGSTSKHDNTKLLELCEKHNAKLLTSRLHHFSRWITPAHLKKRFDTNFFMFNISDSESDSDLVNQVRSKASAPVANSTANVGVGGDAMIAQAGELVLLDWRTPQEYLDASKAEELVLYPPQFYQITQISKFHNWRDLLKYASQMENITALTPKFNKGLEPGSAVMTLPGDNMYNSKQGLDREVDLINKGDPTKPIHRIYFNPTKLGFKNIQIHENLGFIPNNNPKPKL